MFCFAVTGADTATITATGTAPTTASATASASATDTGTGTATATASASATATGTATSRRCPSCLSWRCTCWYRIYLYTFPSLLFVVSRCCCWDRCNETYSNRKRNKSSCSLATTHRKTPHSAPHLSSSRSCRFKSGDFRYVLRGPLYCGR